jgi:hypothetical protein
MENINYFIRQISSRIVGFNLIVLLLAVVYGCNEENVGQPATDSVAPGILKSLEYEAMPGGARISYQLPTDLDLLYVKAVYTINGKEKTATSTLYNKYIDVMGFGNTNPQSITLYSVDRSGNQSEGVNLSIVPGEPPIWSIRESLRIEPTFSGVKLLWDNPTQTDIEVYLLVEDSVTGKLKLSDFRFSNGVDGKFSVYGFESTERLFAAYIRDRWDNYSDTLQNVITPFYEEELDKSLFRRQILPNDHSIDWPGDLWAYMFDGRYNVTQKWHTNQYTYPMCFTVDLGQLVKLSRATLWPRYGDDLSGYRVNNLKYWDVYGIDKLPDNYLSMGDEYWKYDWQKDWQFLGAHEAFKPSGMDNPIITAEDEAYVLKGWSNDFDQDAPPVRYVRYHIKTMWGGGIAFQVCELTFWGLPIK